MTSDGQYSAQLGLIGEEGQQRLRDSSVLVVGAGGLGTHVLYYLAAAGVGKIKIVDPDTVSPSNLNRQILYSRQDVGRPKVQAAAQRLSLCASDTEILPIQGHFDETVGYSLVRGCDLAVLAVDNRETRFAANSVCCKNGIPLVDGGIDGYEGYCTAVLPFEAPCLQCWLGDKPTAKRNPSALGAAVGAVASMESLLAIQLLLGNCRVIGKMLAFDGLNWSLDPLSMERREDCPICGKASPIALE